jgi:hypothetical protein
MFAGSKAALTVRVSVARETSRNTIRGERHGNDLGFLIQASGNSEKPDLSSLGAPHTFVLQHGNKLLRIAPGIVASGVRLPQIKRFTFENRPVTIRFLVGQLHQPFVVRGIEFSMWTRSPATVYPCVQARRFSQLDEHISGILAGQKRQSPSVSSARHVFDCEL